MFPSAVKWSVTVDAAPIAPPLIAGDLVALALRPGVLSAYKAADGAVAWTVKLAVDQPIAADDQRIFVVTGETLHALATDTGATIWSVPIGTPSAPVVARGGWVIAAERRRRHGAPRRRWREGLDQADRGGLRARGNRR